MQPYTIAAPDRTPPSLSRAILPPADCQACEHYHASVYVNDQRAHISGARRSHASAVLAGYQLTQHDATPDAAVNVWRCIDLRCYSTTPLYDCRPGCQHVQPSPDLTVYGVSVAARKARIPRAS